MEALKNCVSRRALITALETLPTTVDDLYQHTLKRIDAQSESEVLLAKKAILWLVHTIIPLSMRELQHALATNLDLSIFDEEDIVRGEIILDACCGLITVSHISTSLSFLRLIRECPSLHSLHVDIEEYLQIILHTTFSRLSAVRGSLLRPTAYCRPSAWSTFPANSVVAPTQMSCMVLFLIV